MMFFICAVTMVCTYPTCYFSYIHNRNILFFAGTFGTLTSIMYHGMESFYCEKIIFLHEGEWHVMDNIGAICVFTYLF